MICPNCHQEISSDATFCGNCGFHLSNSPAVSNTQPPITANPPLSQSNPTAAPPTGAVQPPALQPAYAGANGTVMSQAVAPPPFNAEAIDDGSRENSKAVIAFVLGALGCIGCWFIPVVGVVLGVLAIVFGTMALKSQRRVFAIIGIVLAALAIAVSIFFWVRDAENVLKSNTSPFTGLTTQSTSNSNQTITSPCYITKIPATMTVTQASGSCTFEAENDKTGEEYVVRVLQVPGLSTANLTQEAQADAEDVVNISPGSLISNQQANTFAGSPAYLIYITDTNHSAESIDYIFDTTFQGNIVVVSHIQASGKNTGMSAIENNWAWQ